MDKSYLYAFSLCVAIAIIEFNHKSVMRETQAERKSRKRAHPLFRAELSHSLGTRHSFLSMICYPPTSEAGCKPLFSYPRPLFTHDISFQYSAGGALKTGPKRRFLISGPSSSHRLLYGIHSPSRAQWEGQGPNKRQGTNRKLL